MTAAARASARAAVVCVCFLLASLGCHAATAAGWSVAARSSSHGQARSVSLAAPTNVTATCTNPSTVKTITVSWTAVPRATYLIYQSTTSATAGFSYVTSTTSLTWTSGSLTYGVKYWYEVAVAYTASWIGPNSPATTGHTINRSSPYCS